jgi:hypothetical protein
MLKIKEPGIPNLAEQNLSDPILSPKIIMLIQ